MTPSTATNRDSTSAQNWLKEWDSHNEPEVERPEVNREHHELHRDVWDELAEIERIQRKRNANRVISYLESRLSQLTPTESEKSAAQIGDHDVFSHRHKEVIEKSAKKNR